MPPAADAKRLLAQANKLLAANDLIASRRRALQALDADPLLDGVDQALAVSDVLLAAGKAPATRTDWYAVLRIDPPHAAVDPATIKRKYRKLALLLHPDKNTLPGADAAFKLVSDAWAVLSDPARRAGFDGELAVAAAPSPDNFYAGCPYCNHIHEYPRVYEDLVLRCSKCGSGFRAEEVRIPPELVPGKDAYFFNWGFGCPPAMQMPAIGGFGAGFGPTPFLAPPNPYFALPHAYAAPVPAVKSGGKDDDDEGKSASETVNVRSKSTAVGRKAAKKAKSAAKSRGKAQVKALTSSALVRQSPRLRSGAAENTAQVVEDVKDNPVETRRAAGVDKRKKAAAMKTRNSASNKTAAAEAGKTAGVGTRSKTAEPETGKKAASVETRNKATAPETVKKTAGVETRNKATAPKTGKKTAGAETRNKATAPETGKKTAGVEMKNKAAAETPKKAARVGIRNKSSAVETSNKAAAIVKTRKRAASVNTEKTSVAVEPAVVKGKKAAVSTMNAAVETGKKPAVARKKVAVTPTKAVAVSRRQTVLGLSAWVESVAQRAKSLRSSGVVELAMALPETNPRKRKAAAAPLSVASPEKRATKGGDRWVDEAQVNASEEIGVANVEGIVEDEIEVNANEGIDLLNVEGIVEVEVVKMDGNEDVEVVNMDVNECVEVLKMVDNEGINGAKVDVAEKPVEEMKLDGNEGVDKMKEGGNEGADAVKEGLDVPNDKIGEQNGVMFDLFGNCGDDPADMNGGLMDTDISDILNSLPKIYDASGQEVRF